MGMFSQLSNLELAKLLGKLNKESVSPGEMLFEQGDAGDRMYLIESGKIELFSAAEGGERQLLTVLGPGDVLGEIALLTGEARSATAIAAQPSVLFSIDQLILDQLVAEHPAVSSYFIRQLSQRLVATNSRLQSAKESEVRRQQERLGQLPESARKLVMWCSIMGSAPVALAERACGVEVKAGLIEHPQLLEWLAIDGEGESQLRIRDGSRQLMKELCKLTYGHRVMSEWLEAAIQECKSLSLWTDKILLHGEQENWETLLGDLELYSQEIPASRQQELLRLLQACPVNVLAASFRSLEVFLNWSRQYAPDNGLAVLEEVLEKKAQNLTRMERIVLYGLGAELALHAGRKQLARRYFQLAEVEPGTESAAIRGESGYNLSRLKLNRQRSELLAGSAGRLLKRNRLTVLFAVLFALASIILFAYLEPVGGLSHEAMRFIGIAIAAVILWIINVVPDYLVGLGMVMLWITGGLVTTEAALSGFGSTTWLFMIFIMALSAAITKSGILYRLSLNALKRFPPGYRGQMWGIIAGGMIMNPMIPSSSAKVSLGVPIGRTLSESMGLADGSKGAAGFGLAAMIFYGFTAPFVLTGSYTNVMAYGLVSKSEPVSWLEWFLYALPGFVIFSAVMIAVLLRMFGRTTAPRPISPEVLDEQLRLLGPLSRVEGMTLAAVIGCIGLMILQPVHGVDSTWIMLGGFALLIISGVLDQRTLTSGIDWTFLLFLGVAFSFSAAVDQLGIATAMSGFLKEYIGWVAASPVLFLTAVVLISFIVTLVIRDDPAVILLLTALLPIGSELGIHPWVLVFVILLSTDPFFFTYQSPTYLTAYYSSGGKAFTHRQGQLTALAYGLAVLLVTVCLFPIGNGLVSLTKQAFPWTLRA